MSYSKLPIRTSSDTNASADINQLSENISTIPFRNGVYSNAIINGDMRIAQRGTSFAAVGSGDYTLDRWVYQKSGSMVHTITQETDVPSSTVYTNSIKLDCTTGVADVSIAASDYTLLTQKIEGFNFSPYIKQSLTISFWVKMTRTGTYCVALQNSSSNRSYIAEYTIDASDTWEYKTISLTHDQSGTWLTNNGIGTYLYFVVTAGSDFNAIADTWNGTNDFSTSNQQNGVNSTDNDFYLTGVQMNLGSSALDYSPRHYGDELKLCQRYYEKSYDVLTSIGSNTTNGCWTTVAAKAGTNYNSNYFKVNKRSASYTITQYNPTTGSSGVVRNYTQSNDASVSVDSAGEYSFVTSYSSNDGDIVGGHWTCDAEL